MIHSAFYALALLADDTPAPLPTSTVPDDQVTPGPIGFFAILFVGVVTLLLVIDMVRRIRRTRYREEARARILAEEEGAEAVADTETDDETVDADPDR